MDIKTSDNSEILVDLNGKPVGKYGIRKCIAKITDDNGHVTYSVREFAPRPMDNRTPEYYVPARGVDLTAENLKSICITLREELYNERHARERMEKFEKEYEEDFDDEDDLEEEQEDVEPTLEEIAKIQETLKKEEKEEWETLDPCMDDDYEYELDMVSYGVPDLVVNDNNEHIQLTHSKWRENNCMFDLRVWTPKVNSRGFAEVTPEIDKGLQLDDFEAEMLCQGVENLFPEVLEETQQYIEYDWQDKANVIQVDFTNEEKQILAEAVDTNLNRELTENLVQGCYGVQIGDSENHIFFVEMMDLKGRLERNERITDRQCNLLCNVLYEEYEQTDDADKSVFYGNAYAKLIDLLNERGTNVAGSQTDLREIKKISASKGECLTASLIINRIYEILYNEEVTVEKQSLIDYINDLVIQDIKRRNENFKKLKDGYEDLAGQRFLLNLANSYYMVSNI